MASLLTKSTTTRGRDQVYVATVPLRATKGPPQLLMSAAYSLNLWDLQHFMVIIKPQSPPPDFQVSLPSKLRIPTWVLVYDFQPKDPENIYVALEVLSGRPIPGAILTRKLSKLPRNKCWFVGSSKVNATDMACEFNKNWGTDLRVGHHDCRDYTNGLVEYLTGEKYVLERLQRCNGS
ncbi:PTB domain engulfment adapter [Parasponia andersonii]|uniref:PTB domain engulfment adapter n=1 Tax=Parasponia andersonii TaxID=3476 RepID=A0A2P5BCL3_PARAD|nr:PTB domain engulfment adapter [Parasponia andersonii]